jgi:hypothetical protein
VTTPFADAGSFGGIPEAGGALPRFGLDILPKRLQPSHDTEPAKTVVLTITVILRKAPATNCRQRAAARVPAEGSLSETAGVSHAGASRSRRDGAPGPRERMMPFEILIRQRAVRPRERMNSPLERRKVRLRGL